MKIITELDDMYLQEPSAVTIGKFDGLHKGHQKLLTAMKKRQRQDGLLGVVFTFDIPPASHFYQQGYKVLTTREEKRRIFEETGMDVLVEFPFTVETAAMEPEQFVADMLVRRLRAAAVVAGADCSFGRGGLGNINLLRHMSAALGYEVDVVDKASWQGKEISSTLVREAVEQGRMDVCTRLTGRPYFVSGQVMHGRKLGRTLGMPTINLVPPADKLLPPNGVYVSEVRWRGRVMDGITNVGYKPSVGDERVLGVETYIYDFDGDLYGEWLEVTLQQFVRREQKFDTIERLKQQMEQDIDLGRQYHRAGRKQGAEFF